MCSYMWPVSFLPHPGKINPYYLATEEDAFFPQHIIFGIAIEDANNKQWCGYFWLSKPNMA